MGADERIAQNEKFADRHSAKSHHQCESAVQTIEVDKNRLTGVQFVRTNGRRDCDCGGGEEINGISRKRNGSKISPEAVGPALLTPVLLYYMNNIQFRR